MGLVSKRIPKRGTTAGQTRFPPFQGGLEGEWGG